MSSVSDRINIPFGLLVDTVASLDLEHKIKLWRLLGQEIAQQQQLNHQKSNASQPEVMVELSTAVGRVLVESGMSEDELVESLDPS
ncbi:MAG: hypothetical protein KME17_19985 [Cyanosarcina radialis HA8281-LM2]|jgi:hypothetical protein|nr:hypothetical protein [Cyanosarcina radialis HA8281-LM2]